VGQGLVAISRGDDPVFYEVVWPGSNVSLPSAMSGLSPAKTRRSRAGLRNHLTQEAALVEEMQRDGDAGFLVFA
jgi:hypothetical protein